MNTLQKESLADRHFAASHLDSSQPNSSQPADSSHLADSHFVARHAVAPGRRHETIFRPTLDRRRRPEHGHAHLRRLANVRGGMIGLLVAAVLLVSGLLLGAADRGRRASVATPTVESGYRGETRLSSADGESSRRAIETLEVGDRVLATDPVTGEMAWKRVVRVYRRNADHLWRLGVQVAGTQRTQWIETTEEHPFWVVGRGWVKAGSLRVGDALRQADGRPARLMATSSRRLVRSVPVYNLETEDVHTYFVAADARSAPLLVHNCDADSLKKLYHYTGADPDRIATSGLLPSASGKVYLTPNGTLSPLQAQLDLALPPNRGLPQHLVEIDVKTLQELGIEIPELRQVGRNYNMPGGDLETAIPQWIPPSAIRIVK